MDDQNKPVENVSNNWDAQLESEADYSERKTLERAADEAAEKQETPEDYEKRVAKDRKRVPAHEAAIVSEAQEVTGDKRLLASHLVRYSDHQGKAAAGEQEVYCPELGIYAYFDVKG